MPVYLKPGAEAPIWLDADENEDPRPTFFCQALTLDEQIEAADEYDEMVKITAPTTHRELMERPLAMFRSYLLRTANLPDDFELRFLQYGELRELIRKLLYSQALGAEQKKA